MDIVEILIEKYEWAINLYIIGGVIAFILAATVIIFVGYNMIRKTKRDNIESAKRREEFEKRSAEMRNRMEEQRNEFFKR